MALLPASRESFHRLVGSMNFRTSYGRKREAYMTKTVTAQDRKLTIAGWVVTGLVGAFLAILYFAYPGANHAK